MKATVACGHPRITEIASEMLQSGGNAFDASIAAAFAASVSETALTSLGGGGFLLAHTKDNQDILFDFFGNTPGLGLRKRELEPHFLPITMRFPHSNQIFNVGLGSVAVPGNLRGFLHVHRRLGRMPLSEIVAPAIEDARQGVGITNHQGYFLELVKPMMTLTSAGRKLYGSGENYLRAGDHFKNPDFAVFLDTLAKMGDREFYEGELATKISLDMRRGQGLITKKDLKTYTVVERVPLRTSYRGHELLTNPSPSFGGVLLSTSLQVLEEFDLARLKFGSTKHLECLVSVMQDVDRRRSKGEILTPSTQLASGGTTHITVGDREGNIASLSISNGEGSGYIVPGTGIMLNNMMGEDDLHPEGFHVSPPGMRVSSMMSPSILKKGNRIVLALGSGGSKRIRTALLQVISNVIDFKVGLKEAIERPRVHWDGTQVHVEPEFSESVVLPLRKRWSFNKWERADMYFGGVHGIQPGKDSAGDPRRGGSSFVLDY